ncbi:MAG: 2-hydroxyacid dehydrogenase [Spirochaetales bacterium]|nr:2-hydroxyacid dehydrogenase [Spirochaetales bacterium]
MKMKIAFFDAKKYDIDFFNEANKEFEFTIKYFSERLSIDTVIMASGYDAVCAFVNDDINEEVILKLEEQNIGLIAMRCSGYNNIDIKTALNKIQIARVPAYSPYAVAEHALALIMSLNRKTHKAYNRTRESNFSIKGLLGFDLHGKKAGVIGTGKIGRIFIKIVKGLGMNVVAYDPYPNESHAKDLGFSYAGIDELYRSSDVISLHCPLIKDTFHLIDKDAISLMKKNVMLINTSRGGLIDTKALVDSLKEGKVGYVGLDVYEEEENFFFEDHSDSIITDDILARLQTFGNVLITSHQAFFTKEALCNISFTTLSNIKEFQSGNTLTNEICYHCDQN